MEHLFQQLPVPITLLLTLGSLAILVISADVAIGRAVATARQYHISPLIIGTTLVAMSTSLAELAVNMAITLSGGNNAIVVGNIFGSNLVNIGLGLGISAFITSIRTTTLVIEREILLYFAVTALFTGFALGGTVSRLEGGILVACFVLIMYLIYQYAARDRDRHEEEKAPEFGAELLHQTAPTVNALYAAGALVVLVLSAEVLVSAAAVLARAAGISPYIISLTVIGIGTSLPEIVTSIQAARTGHIDLVLGNVFGSNVFNICIALGLPALIRTVRIPATGRQDIYFINVYGIVVAFLLLGEYQFLGRNKVIGRWGGMLLVAIYLGYILWKIVAS